MQRRPGTKVTPSAIDADSSPNPRPRTHTHTYNHRLLTMTAHPHPHLQPPAAHHDVEDNDGDVVLFTQGDGGNMKSLYALEDEAHTSQLVSNLVAGRVFVAGTLESLRHIWFITFYNPGLYASKGVK
eukprot:1147744-Pelagomonas_calceolata.AAC.7